MKTQIQYLQTDGGEGVALIVGPTSSLEQAKVSLANQLNLPDVGEIRGANQNVDARLRQGGIDPESITFSQVAE
jgi:hypothetical protein